MTKCHRRDERSDQRDDYGNPDQRHAQQHDQHRDADQTNNRQRKNDGEWARLGHVDPARAAVLVDRKNGECAARQSGIQQTSLTFPDR